MKATKSLVGEVMDELKRLQGQRRAARTFLRVIGKLAEERGAEDIARQVKEGLRALR